MVCEDSGYDGEGLGDGLVVCEDSGYDGEGLGGGRVVCEDSGYDGGGRLLRLRLERLGVDVNWRPTGHDNLILAE